VKDLRETRMVPLTADNHRLIRTDFLNRKKLSVEKAPKKM
jgi:hypothetical protein